MASRHALSAHSLSRQTERFAVFVLCALAGARVFVFAAAFPFFNNVDERRHFDLVIKYSSGYFPRGPELISPETLPYLAWYASPEYLAVPEDLPGGDYGPFWTHPAEEVAPTIATVEQIWGRTPNQESSQPPLYYLAAGLWFDFGKLAGLKHGTLLYWTRLVNVPLAALLVWLSYVAAQRVFANRPDLRVAVPLLIAFLPQDAFYGIENDVLSPICFGAAFICLTRWLREDRYSLGLGVLTGITIAAAYLTKASNLPLVLVAFAAIAFCCFGQIRAGKLRHGAAALLALIFSALVPMAAWAIWTKINFGDFTGAATKAQLLGWTAKPIAQWWPHPIFTAAGFWTFSSELLASFWRGEFMWHGHTIGSVWLNLFYVLSSIALSAVAIGSLLLRRNPDPGQRRVLWLAAASVIAAVVFLALLSLQFDFGNCINPSRARPYFFQGRLMLGALVPFALVYVYGLDRLLQRWPFLLLPVLGVVMIIVMAADAFANRVAFSSPYNWFHM
ncbi:MAG: DUF2142 domain-containing protein [Chthoniobacterales bacterium]